MGKKKKGRNNLELISFGKNLSQGQPVTSFLDIMQDGKEYESIISLKNVNVDFTQEIKRSLREISSIRGRPLICYAANVINNSLTQSISFDNSDDTPFLEMVHNAPNDNRDLDIILVTPGGSAETVAYLVKQIRERFDHVAFILPYMAMSAGTIFCMSGDEIIMDESAFFGPIDPQVPGKNGRWLPAQSLETLLKDIQERGNVQIKNGLQPDWTDILILNNIDPKELGNVVNGSKLSTRLVSEYLEEYKFKSWNTHHDGKMVTSSEKKQKASEIAKKLCDHSLWLSHASRISRKIAWEECGLKIIHPENINGLARAIKRFWAMMNFMFEKILIVKVFASENYTLFRVEKQS